MSETPAASDEAHTGPIKTPKQMLWISVLAFILPVLIIVGLVWYVTAAPKPSNVDTTPEQVAQRLAKVGEVKLGVDPAKREQMTGEAVFKAQCATCHAAGLAGAPKLGDAAAWGPRLGQAFDALVQSAVKGKGGMAAQGGGDFTDFEIARAVAFMANKGGGKFAEPKAPAAAPAASSAAAPAATAPAASDAAAPAPAASPAADVKPAAGESSASAPAAAAAPALSADAGKKLYEQACVACHAAGVAGAPKLGDKSAWQPRLAQGVNALTAQVIAGKGAMPPRGASTATDAELRAAVEYMTAASK
jgi:cytochrome c5